MDSSVPLASYKFASASRPIDAEGFQHNVSGTYIGVRPNSDKLICPSGSPTNSPLAQVGDERHLKSASEMVFTAAAIALYAFFADSVAVARNHRALLGLTLIIAILL